MNNLAPVREQTGIRHFIDLRDLDASTLRAIIDVGASVKRIQSGRKFPLHPKQPLAGRSLGLMLEKPSTRTRISFEVGMGQLGGRTLILSPADMQVGRGESLADTARVLSRFLDALVVRTGDVETLRELTRWSSIPVVNGLTPVSHPVQILADIMTFEEHRGPVAGTKWAWVGDGNNVATSLIEGAVRFDFSLDLATPPSLAPRPEVLDWARREGGRIRLFHDPEDAVKNADCVVTDTWTSMSDTDSEERLEALRPFQVSKHLMSQAASGALFMHCLPAHVGEEVSSEVFESAASVVFDEAENRLHAQKGLLLWCLGGKDWASAGLASRGRTDEIPIMKMSDMPASHPPAAAIPDIVINDAIQPFHLSGSPVRGRLVRLGGLADAILSRKALGAAAHLGGQALSLVAGMSAGLKFEGALSLQVKGDGPVSLLVADSTHDGAVRLYMRLAEDNRPHDLPETEPRADIMFGKGYFAFTIDQGPKTDRQQGIVTLEGVSLSEMAEHYFATSEQLPTLIRLFSRFQDGKWDAGVLVLERIADEGGRESHDAAEDHWETAKTFAATLTAEEVFNPHLTHSALLYRVFGTLGVAVAPPRPARFGCRCAREKLLSVLRNFGDDNLDEMAENGVITMSCEFCGIDYRFDRNNIAPDPV